MAPSVCWISGALITGDAPLWTQNLVLFCINLFGVYCYLLRKRWPRDAD